MTLVDFAKVRANLVDKALVGFDTGALDLSKAGSAKRSILKVNGAKHGILKVNGSKRGIKAI